MAQNRLGQRRRLKDKDFNIHELLSQVVILHHTDPELAQRVTSEIMLERAYRGDFHDPVIKD